MHHMFISSAPHGANDPKNYVIGQPIVKTMLCVNVQMETMDGVFKIAAEKDNVFSTVGVHPNTDKSAHDPTIDELVDARSVCVFVAVT